MYRKNLRTDSEFQYDVYKHIGKYTTRSWIHSLVETSVTILLFYICFQLESLLWTPLLALTFVRAFIIFHDMSHNSFFPSKIFNIVGGLIFGSIVLTPMSYWVKGHPRCVSVCVGRRREGQARPGRP